MAKEGKGGGEDERTRIQRGLIELCVEQTFREVTLPQLLERAEVGPDEFHRHFEDLEDCFCSFYLEMRDEYMQRVGAAFLAVDGWQNQIRAAAWETAEFIREDLGRARICFVEVWSAERAKLIRDEAMQVLFAMIDLGRQERDDESISALTAEFVGSVVYQRLQVGIERGDLEALEAELPELLYAVVLPYLGREAAEEELNRAGEGPAPRGSP